MIAEIDLADVSRNLRDLAEVLVLVVGIVSIVVTPVAAFVRRPRVEVHAAVWVARDPVPWHFATVGIRNAPPPRWFPVARLPALSSRVSVAFWQNGDNLAVGPVPARWSARSEPIRSYPVAQGDGFGLVQIPAAELLPDTYEYDLLAGGRWEEVAVAVLLDDGAFAWGAESYFHNWRNPDWKLDRGEYDVAVTVEHSGGRDTESFTLRYLSDDHDEFRLRSRDA